MSAYSGFWKADGNFNFELAELVARLMHETGKSFEQVLADLEAFLEPVKEGV